VQSQFAPKICIRLIVVRRTIIEHRIGGLQSSRCHSVSRLRPAMTHRSEIPAGSILEPHSNSAAACQPTNRSRHCRPFASNTGPLHPRLDHHGAMIRAFSSEVAASSRAERVKARDWWCPGSDSIRTGWALLCRGAARGRTATRPRPFQPGARIVLSGRRESVRVVVGWAVITWAVIDRPGLWFQTVATSWSDDAFLGKRRRGEDCGKKNNDTQYFRFCHWLLRTTDRQRIGAGNAIGSRGFDFSTTKGFI